MLFETHKPESAYSWLVRDVDDEDKRAAIIFSACKIAAALIVLGGLLVLIAYW